MSSTLPDTRVYTNLAGLDALKRGAKANDPATLRQVAKQFESLFARMMIQSMRDAVGTDPIFGSDQEKMYQGMFDDQLSMDITRGKGLGLADMLVRQLQRTASTKAAASTTHPAAAPTAPTSAATATGVGGAAPASPPAAHAQFVQTVWPHAVRAGEQLGVDPRTLIAQAALETNWGQHTPRDAAGRSSNNLFGIKGGGQWGGEQVTAATQEYAGGTATTTTAAFRAYPTAAHSFEDYVSLLRGNPRYAAALNTGSDAHAFATALQRGGYATDPHYAQKLTAIAARLGAASPTEASARSLKFVTELPISISGGEL